MIVTDRAQDEIVNALHWFKLSDENTDFLSSSRSEVREDYSIGSAGGWTHIVGRDPTVFDEALRSVANYGGNCIGYLFQSVSNVYANVEYDDGILISQWYWVDGELVDLEGKEPDTEGDLEFYLFDLWSQKTGLHQRDMDGVNFKVLEKRYNQSGQVM